MFGYPKVDIISHLTEETSREWAHLQLSYCIRNARLCDRDDKPEISLFSIQRYDIIEADVMHR